MSGTTFQGFPKETTQFLTDLAANNNKPWFHEHKEEFERIVMTPAREFVLALGERLREISPGVVADPRVNKSIFRIYRDTRFSKDKTPYKTNLGLWFWVGEGHKFENPGYYFHLDANNLMLAVGLHSFSKPLLQAYRDAVVAPSLGPVLAQVITEVAQQGFRVGERTYKRTPRGYDPEHPNADLLRHSGLTAGKDLGLPAELYTPNIVDYCIAYYQQLHPVVQWLQQMKEHFPA